MGNNVVNVFMDINVSNLNLKSEIQAYFCCQRRNSYQSGHFQTVETIRFCSHQNSLAHIWWNPRV